MMESSKALPSFTANRLHPPPNTATAPTHSNVGLRLRLIQPTLPGHRGAAKRFPYDGIAEGASIVYREPAASTTQHRNRTHSLERRITPSANPTYSTEHRGVADRRPYDGIAEGASVVYRDWATPPTADPTYTFGSLIRRGGKDA